MALVTVAVGILIDDAGRVLVTRRAPGAHQGGLWEFPGGKLEEGETLLEALTRELSEELGVRVETTEPFMVLEHDYGDKQVRLDIHRVTRWSGEPRGLEGQPLAWQRPEQLRDWAFPAANRPILERLLAG
jgi:8-oxo-dGTP diphosphatase